MISNPEIQDKQLVIELHVSQFSIIEQLINLWVFSSSIYFLSSIKTWDIQVSFSSILYPSLHSIQEVLLLHLLHSDNKIEQRVYVFKLLS